MSIPSFQVFRMDRNRHGSGVLFFVHEKLAVTQTKFSNKDHETLWIKMSRNKSKSIFLSVSYRSPSVKNRLENTIQMYYLREMTKIH